MPPPNTPERPSATGFVGGQAQQPLLTRTGSPAGASTLADVGTTGSAAAPAAVGGQASAPFTSRAGRGGALLRHPCGGRRRARRVGQRDGAIPAAGRR